MRKGARSSWAVILAGTIVGAAIGGAVGAALSHRWAWLGESLGIGPFGVNLDVLRFSFSLSTSPAGLAGALAGFILFWKR